MPLRGVSRRTDHLTPDPTSQYDMAAVVACSPQLSPHDGDHEGGGNQLCRALPWLVIR